MTVEWPTLRRVIAVALDLSERRITMTAKAGDPAEWDSLMHMLLMLELEKVFEVRLTKEDFDHLTSAEIILGWLNEDRQAS